MGVNDHLYRPEQHHLLTAASCTTNCLAPVVKVIHEGIGIRHGVITTIHDMTNTQTIVDAPHKDLRRARASSLSLIPTTTGSATAIGLIYPELKGRLNGIAVRVPLLNASLTDCVFEVERDTTVRRGQRPAEGRSRRPAAGHPGLRRTPAGLHRFQGRSAFGHRRCAIHDGRGRDQVKVLAWYDNEWGYVNRMVELARKVAAPCRPGAEGRQHESSEVDGTHGHGSRRRATPNRRERSPQLHSRDGSLLGGHAHRRRDPHAGAALLQPARLLGHRSRDAVPLLRGLRHRHQPGRRLAGRPARPEDDAVRRAGHAGVRPDHAGAVDPRWLSIPYVMVAQALSGIAKDLTKMSSKSAIKLVVAEDAQSTLFKWVAILTGSKNALKGVGFFVGGLLLYLVGFQTSLLILAGLVLTALVSTALLMNGDLGTANKKAKFGQIFSNNRAVNILAAARVFLFASRDVWFVVGLPVFLYTVLGWNFWQVGGFLAVWIIGYGVVQASARSLLRRRYAAQGGRPTAGLLPGWPSSWLFFRRGLRWRWLQTWTRTGDRRRADCLRRHLRHELGGPLVPDPGLHRQRQGGDERRLLLHGQRLRPAGGHRALGRALPVRRVGRLPVGVRGFQPGRGIAVVPVAGFRSNGVARIAWWRRLTR